MKLEICATSFLSAIAAQEGGADRIELCDNLKEGGTTPSYGTIKEVRKALSIDVYSIIRPRGGDFVYSRKEFEIMYNDVLISKDLGCNGVVIGLLKENGEINEAWTRQLVKAAAPMGVTFHRAFDRTRDPFSSLEKIIDCGCERILTSGQRPTAQEGVSVIRQLVEKAGERIIIMPGSGINPENITFLIQETRAQEFHSTAKTRAAGKMIFKNNLSEKDEETLFVTDKNLVKRLKDQIRLQF